ncbi:MAG: ABC transporter substrate-binding protein [Lachnospiraceae bacterium]|nr:ABC transporter substrate-binding protein [Lachnospiraceae bacterium]
MKKKKWLIYVALIIVLIIAGCIFQALWKGNKKEQVETEKVLNLVVLDSGDYYHIDDGIDAGLKMAFDSLEERFNLHVNLSVVDDEGDYVKGIALAKSLAADPNVDIVMSFQNFDSIGPEAPFFEEAKKPFIVTMGCYDEVAESGYQYFIADFMSGKTIGREIGKNLQKNGAKNVALCHSDTRFEQDEIRGIQSQISQDDSIRVVHTQTGPFQVSELSELLLRCKQLSVDTVVANFYNQEDCAWLLSMLSESGQDLVLVGDYAIDSPDILQQYGTSLEGVSIIPNYPYTKSPILDEFIAEYEKTTGLEFSSVALQYYDLMAMIGAYWQVTGGRTDQVMKLVKKQDGYESIGGNIRFDANGCLSVEDAPMYICKDGHFEPVEKDREKAATE